MILEVFLYLLGNYENPPFALGAQKAHKD